MEKIRIGDACDILNGFAFKSDKYVEGGIRVIRIANVQKGYIEDDAPVFYPADYAGLEKYMLEEGDLLMSLTGNVGRVGILQKEMLPAALNQRVACLRLKTECITKGFLFHVLNSVFFEQQCVYTSNGVAQKNMSTEWLKDYEIPLYPIKEQLKITEVLDRIRCVINLRSVELRRLDDLIKARFVEMFGSIKEERLLGDISEFVTVGIANSATHAYAESGIPMLRNQNIKENYLDDTDIIYIKSEFATQYESKKLKENDIIVMRTGYPGVACLVPKKYEGCQTFTTLIVRLKEDNNSSYVCSYINSDFGKKFIDSEKVGVAQQNVGAKSLAKMPIKIPPIELQNQFAAFVAEVDKSKLMFQKLHQKLNILQKKAGDI